MQLRSEIRGKENGGGVPASTPISPRFPKDLAATNTKFRARKCAVIDELR
jgi:hypothetical protein